MKTPSTTMNKCVTCLKCQHAAISVTEVNCTYGAHPGRVMARDLRYEVSAANPMRHVSGMEWAKHCAYFAPRMLSPSKKQIAPQK